MKHLKEYYVLNTSHTQNDSICSITFSTKNILFLKKKKKNYELLTMLSERGQDINILHVNMAVVYRKIAY